MTDTITLPREVAELALDALEFYWGGQPMGPKKREAVHALRDALAAEQPKQEHFAVLAIACKDKEIDRLTDENEALRWDAERLRELLKEARDSLGCEYDDAVLNLAERIDAFFEQRGVIVGRYGVALRREDKT